MAGRDAGGGSTARWHEEWATALDELELSIDDVRLLLSSPVSADKAPTPWRQPDGLGPLPAELRPRAEAILARQTAAAQEIIATLVGNRRQAAFAARLETGACAPGPAYVDRAV